MASTTPLSFSNTTPPNSTSNVPHVSTQRSLSCVLCAQRKVKCDKRPSGCVNCAKARVPCIYKAPPPSRRKKKGTPDTDIHSRLRLYEDALRELGVEPADLENKLDVHRLRPGDISVNKDEPLNTAIPVGSDKRSTSIDNEEPGVLISGDGKSRYLENGLWTSLKGELRDSKDILDESSDEEDQDSGDVPTPEPFSPDGGNLLFRAPKSAAMLRSLHPQPLQIFKLWQTYLDNINPLVKVFHTPTIQQVILNASGTLDDIPKNIEALMFSIYCVALASLGRAECDAIMGEPKHIVMQRFRLGAQHALVNTGFLKTSDLMVLQAFVLFLLSLHNYDARVLWIFSGVAVRIGQRIGLHRDGEILGLPPFEVEIRRRLWWQIMFIEGSTQKLAGTGGNVFMGDTKMPSNLNDSDLFQDMKEMPKEHEGATEMMHFRIRCHVGEFLKRITDTKNNFDGAWNKLSTAAVATLVKDKAIDDLDAVFKHKYLQYCDSSIPWHFMCIYLVKAVIFMLRFVAHNADQRTGPMLNASRSEADMLFNISLQVVSYQNMAYTTKQLQGFLWHINMNFQWKAFIYLISQLRYRTYGHDVDNAWEQVQLVYEFHPNLTKMTSKEALPIAVGNLTLKAWDVFIESRGVPTESEPYFIQVLRTQSSKRASKTMSQEPAALVLQVPTQLPTSASIGDNPSFTDGGHGLAFDSLDSLQWTSDFASTLDTLPIMPELPSFDLDNMSWSAWDNLVLDFKINDAAFADVPQFNFGAQ